MGFLIQACLATTLAFTGMHVTIFLLDDARAAYWVPCKIKSTSRCEQAVHQDDNPDTNFWAIVADFCYFSFAIMTTTGDAPAAVLTSSVGYGDMFARSFFARLVVTLQMLTANLLSVRIYLHIYCSLLLTPNLLSVRSQDISTYLRNRLNSLCV